ncbi:MAG: HAMP domain-containing histidine kinase [Deltaproteobacteria bacterium]|nr:HAMP domain-containing histidine kinase [Deltaproteobacteria bacterium]
MNDARAKTAMRESGGGLAAPAVSMLLLAGVLPAAFAYVSEPTGREVVAVLGSGLLVAAIQVVVLAGLSVRARRRITESASSAPARSFPLVLVGVLAVLGLGLFPAALFGAALASDIDVAELFVEHGPVWAVIELLLLVALHRAARAWSSRQANRANHSGAAGHAASGSATKVMIAVLVVPAVAVSFGLAWKAEQALRAEALHGASDVYRNLTEAVLTAPPLTASAGAAGVVEALTRFDEASPFAFAPAIGWKGAIDEQGRQLLERELIDSPRGASVNGRTGVGLVWSTLGDRETVVGVRLSVAGDPRSPYILISLVLAAAFGAALISLWFGGRLRTVLDRRAAALESLPEREPPPIQPTIAREIAHLDTEIAKVRSAVIGQREVQRELIGGHKDLREKKARVFTGMSHDLRSPLNSVIGFTDLLLKGMDGELEPEQRAAVSRIAQEAERLLVLIGDILDTAKLEAGRFELERTWVPSVEILTECEVGALRLVASRDIEFTCELQPGLPPVLVDKDRVLQALLSLICRAVDSMESGTVRLKAWKLASGLESGSELRVDIIDSGGVLPAETRQRLAGALGSSQDREASGSGTIGLGVSLARRILKLHGGDVTLSSHDKGSVFSVTVPLDESPDGA